MREIKFRVWDSTTKKFDYWGFDIFNGQCVVSFVGPPSDYTGRFVHSQFTGLKDKNGKEIYEGDILNNTMPLYKGQKTKQVVEWVVYQWKGIWGYNDCEVIGNIYENPELLK